MSARMILWLAVVVMAVEALVMNNVWALGIGIIVALIGILSEQRSET